MLSSNEPSKRLILGAWLAALSILVNAALHGSWAQEKPLAGGPGGSFSICLAHGGPNGATPTETRDSTGSENDQCDLCVIPASYGVPTSETSPSSVIFQNTSKVFYRYDDALIRSQDLRLQFDARGPPT